MKTELKLWTCPNCGRELISGPVCPTCAVPQEDVENWEAEIEPKRKNDTLEKRKPGVARHHFWLHSDYAPFMRRERDYLRFWDQPGVEFLIAGGIFLGLGALLSAFSFMSFVPFFGGLFSLTWLIPAGVAVGWYFYSDPKRQRNRKLAREGRLVNGEVDQASGQWRYRSSGKSGKWDYWVELQYQFETPDGPRSGRSELVRNDLGSPRPFFLLTMFRRRLDWETSSQNPLLPPPGTPIDVLYVDDNTFEVI